MGAGGGEGAEDLICMKKLVGSLGELDNDVVTEIRVVEAATRVPLSAHLSDPFAIP
jgi:hypothetical protein